MRRISAENAELMASVKGIVFQKTGRKYELTTPDGGTTEEFDRLDEVIYALESDPTFASLPKLAVKLAGPVTDAAVVYYVAKPRDGLFPVRGKSSSNDFPLCNAFSQDGAEAVVEAMNRTPSGQPASDPGTVPA